MSDATFRCVIHDVSFSVTFHGDKPDDSYVGCPLCLARDLKEASRDRDAYRRQRNDLLAMIDLARAVQVQL